MGTKLNINFYKKDIAQKVDNRNKKSVNIGGKIKVKKVEYKTYVENLIKEDNVIVGNKQEEVKENSFIQNISKKKVSINKPKVNVNLKDLPPLINLDDIGTAYYDVVIMIPTHNRYEKLMRIINTINEQESKYSYCFVILNDGSDDKRYDNLKNEKGVLYLKNEKPNGKLHHWYCYNQLWHVLKKIDGKYVLQMDDDFILPPNFINTIIDRFKEVENKYDVFALHNWSFSFFRNTADWDSYDNYNSLDGIGLIKTEVIKEIGYGLEFVSYDVLGEGKSVGAWKQFTDKFKKNKKRIFRDKISYVWHDGNEDSQLHGNFRKKKQMYTINYIEHEK